MRPNFSIVFSLLLSAGLSVQAQERSIATAMSYLLTRPDARSSAMGDVGAATSPDPYSLYANPSKIAFIPYKAGLGLSYEPLMPYLTKDVSLANLSGIKKIGERDALGLSVYFLSYGKIEGTDDNGNFTQNIFPLEYTLDFTYARKMSDQFSMGFTARYLHSDIHDGASNNNTVVEPSNAFAVDVSAYFEKEQVRGFYGAKWAFGALISNIGTKVRYAATKTEFLPSNLKLGAAYSFLMDGYVQRLTIHADLNKLLVPSPPIYDNNGQIIAGKDPNRSVVSSLLSSFTDAPGGFSEELQEISIGTGVEYVYKDSFALRTGYFHEHQEKGNRQHFALGTGFNHKNLGLDLAYLIPTTNRFVLKNSIKFSFAYRLK
ncbi:MAG: hypothetical protein RI924_458 [Bacteroidota bacterium]|jgi:hypothetical protein